MTLFFYFHDTNFYSFLGLILTPFYYSLLAINITFLPLKSRFLGRIEGLGQGGLVWFGYEVIMNESRLLRKAP